MDRIELESKVDSFINKYAEQEKGFPDDDSFKGECLSIVKIFIQEVFGITAPPSGSGSAFGYWLNFPSPLPNIFEKVEITTGAVPQKGDILIWSVDEEKHRPFGHIDIFLSGDAGSFIGFDQNWNGREAHKQPHRYDGIVGWLTPVNVTIPSEAGMGFTDQTKIPIGGDYGVVELQALRSLLKDRDRKIVELSERVENLTNPNHEPLLGGNIPPEAGLFHVTVTAEGDGLRIRTGPGTKFNKIRNLRRDDQVAVFGLSGNNVWLRIQEGFIMFKPEWLAINSGG
jgi:hypothetical protein